MSKASDQRASELVDIAHRRALYSLLWRMSLYYAVLAAVVAGGVAAFPWAMDVLPVGGIADYRPLELTPITQGGPVSATTQPTEAWLVEAASLALAMLCSLALMVPVAWLYKAIHQGQEFDHSIDETSLVMPAVVAGVVTVAQHSLALAFSLAGIVAGVRFRRALSDTFDTLFIFVAIGVGLAAGVGAVEIAAVITVFFTYTTALTCIFGDGLESRHAAKLARMRPKAEKKAKGASGKSGGKPKRDKAAGKGLPAADAADRAGAPAPVQGRAG